jgi:hypothetical protein
MPLLPESISELEGASPAFTSQVVEAAVRIRIIGSSLSGGVRRAGAGDAEYGEGRAFR